MDKKTAKFLPKFGQRVYVQIYVLYILYAIIYVFTELQTMVPKTAEMAQTFTLLIARNTPPL